MEIINPPEKDKLVEAKEVIAKIYRIESANHNESCDGIQDSMSRWMLAWWALPQFDFYSLYDQIRISGLLQEE